MFTCRAEESGLWVWVSPFSKPDQQSSQKKLLSSQVGTFFSIEAFASSCVLNTRSISLFRGLTSWWDFCSWVVFPTLYSLLGASSTVGYLTGFSGSMVRGLGYFSWRNNKTTTRSACQHLPAQHEGQLFFSGTYFCDQQEESSRKTVK